MKMKWKKMLVLLTAAALSGLQIKAMADETSAESRKLSVLSVSGDEAYVVKGSARELPAVGGMPLGQGSRARTGYKTSLYLIADEDKTIKMDSSSQVEITKASSKKLKITLKSGAIFFNVENPLGEGQEMEFQAAQTSMSIRGTSGVIRTDGEDVTVSLISGHVTIESTGAGTQGQAQSAYSLNAGERTVIRENSARGQATGFTWEDLDAFGLGAAMEQSGRLDGSAIGLESRDQLNEASQALPELREEKDRQEEADQAARQEQIDRDREEAGDGSSRIEGDEPADVDEDDDSGYTAPTERETVPETTSSTDSTETDTFSTGRLAGN